MNKEELIKFLYYLWDKIDPIYLEEVNVSVRRFLKLIDKHFR